MKLTQLFCDEDDFCQTFILEWQKNQLTNGEKKRNRPHRMCFSEMITLLRLAEGNHRRVGFMALNYTSSSMIRAKSCHFA